LATLQQTALQPAQEKDRTLVEDLTRAMTANRKLEQQLGKDYVKAILIDTEALGQPELNQSCPLQSTVREAAVVRMTSRYDFSHRGGVITRPASAAAGSAQRCPREGCGIELYFRVEPCGEENGAQCLKLALRFPNSSSTGKVATRSDFASSPLTQCPSPSFVHDLINSAIDDLARAMDLNSAFTTPAGQIEDLHVTSVDVQDARLLGTWRKTLIKLREPTGDNLPNFSEKLQSAIPGLIRYDSIAGFSKSAPSGGLELSWQFDKAKGRLLVQLRSASTTQPQKLTELSITGKNLDLLPGALAIATAHGLISYYERQAAQDVSASPTPPRLTPAPTTDCHPAFAPASGFLLAGLPQLGDCTPSNDTYGTIAAVSDVVLVIGAGTMGYLASVERTHYANNQNPSTLELSKGLFIGTGVALSLAIVGRGLSVGLAAATPPAVQSQAAQR